VQNTTLAPGEIVAPDGALVEISASVDGIADADANRNAPSVGQSVRRGQVLVVLSPTAQEGGFAQARARLERLEREVARDERLYAAGAIPQRRSRRRGTIWRSRAQRPTRWAAASAATTGSG
jgi:multidrug resistance efflux pump